MVCSETQRLSLDLYPCLLSQSMSISMSTDKRSPGYPLLKTTYNKYFLLLLAYGVFFYPVVEGRVSVPPCFQRRWLGLGPPVLNKTILFEIVSVSRVGSSENWSTPIVLKGSLILVKT